MPCEPATGRWAGLIWGRFSDTGGSVRRRRRAASNAGEKECQGCASSSREQGAEDHGHRVPPNGSRLSCGRNARWRKEMEAQTKRLAGEATQFFLIGER